MTEKHFNYDSEVLWPLLDIIPPRFVEGVTQELQDVDQAINIRIPVALKRTIDAHTQFLRVNRSEWIRTALTAVLGAEQKLLEKNQKV